MSWRCWNEGGRLIWWNVFKRNCSPTFWREKLKMANIFEHKKRKLKVSNKGIVGPTNKSGEWQVERQTRENCKVRDGARIWESTLAVTNRQVHTYIPTCVFYSTLAVSHRGSVTWKRKFHNHSLYQSCQRCANCSSDASPNCKYRHVSFRVWALYFLPSGLLDPADQFSWIPSKNVTLLTLQ